MSKKKNQATQKTPKGHAIPARSREDVLEDFRKAAGPLRGRNRDQKPKA